MNCGKKNKLKKLVTLGSSKRSYNVKKIVNKSGKRVKVKKTTYYKFMIIAVDSKNNIVSSSKIIHAATKGNIKKATKLKATFTKAKNAKVKKHVRIRLESSNVKIAKVSSKGKVTAKKKGTCKIYVIGQNGVYKTVKVKVK